MDEKKQGVKEDKNEEALRLSVKEGSLYAVMDGVGNAYVSPFAIAMNASNTHIGLLSAIPNLIAPLAQLSTIKAMENVESRKKLVVKAAILQAIMWVPMLLIPFFFLEKGPLLLIIFYSLLAIFASFIVPVWTSWMGDLVDEKKRGTYFGRRHKVTGFVALVVTFLAGLYLDLFKNIDSMMIFYGFATLFFIAFIARLATTYFFKKQYEPDFKFDMTKYFSLWQFIKKMSGNNFGRFVIYTTLTHMVVYIAAPFFTVYMLKDLGFSYTMYTVINIAASLATLISMPYWGKFGDKYGTIKMLRIAGFLIFTVPLLWAISPLVPWLIPYLLIAELVSGVAWAGYNLAAGNFLYDAVTRERRPLCVAYSNILRGIGIFIGSIIGGYLATNITISFMHPLLFIFLISATLRLLLAIIFLPVLQEVRMVEKGPILRMIHLHPLQSRQGFLRGIMDWVYFPHRKNDDRRIKGLK